MGHSLASLKVLRAFLDDPSQPQYGLELSAASGVKAGALYPILARLHADGWIAGEWEAIDEAAEGRRRRRYYVLSGAYVDKARELLAETSASLAPPSTRRPAPRREWATS